MLAFIAVVSGLVLLVWSADRFVEGSAITARHFGMPALLVGMVIVGFGTSLPELLVSALASWQGSSGIALGNAYGSNISNIALILGLTALISPIAFQSLVLRKELPVLTVVTALAAWQLSDREICRTDATILLAVFAGLMAWAVWTGFHNKDDTLRSAVRHTVDINTMPIRQAVSRLMVGLVLLIVSSRILVWGAVEIAHGFGVSDLVIGLTVIALGTSLPELASSIAAIRKREHDIALGNILGSNLFNTLAVVGISGLIRPVAVAPEVLSRDVPVMAALTLSLFIIGYRFRHPGRINRIEGGVLLACYVVYMAYLLSTAL
jgi:cation:H+ antiporter